MDKESGANPFGHAVILFLEQQAPGAAWKLHRAYGAYSQNTTTTHIVHKAIKDVLGIKFDLQDTHMILKEEEARHLNLGLLKAKHFNVDQEKYAKCEKYIFEQIEKEHAAIEDLNQQLAPASQNGHERYKLELDLVKQGKIPESRLQPFHIDTTLSYDGSSTCKHWALKFLLDNELMSKKEQKQFIGTSSSIGSTSPVKHGFEPTPLLFVSVNGSTPFVKTNGTSVSSYDWDKSDLRAVLPIDKNVPEKLGQYLPQINGQLQKLRKIEEKINGLPKKDQKPDLLRCHERILKLTKEYTQFSNLQVLGDLQQTIETLNEQSQNLINVYSYVNLPKELQESLLLRLYYSQAMRQLAIGLLILGVSMAIAAYFSDIPAISAASACVLTGLYIIYRVYQAITEEQQFQVCSAQYSIFSNADADTPAVKKPLENVVGINLIHDGTAEHTLR